MYQLLKIHVRILKLSSTLKNILFSQIVQYAFLNNSMFFLKYAELDASKKGKKN